MNVGVVVLGILVVSLLGAWLMLRGPDIPYETLEAQYVDAASRFVDLPGGFHVHYKDHGAPTLPLLVLLHGLGDSHTTWEGWVSELQGKFRIIGVDFPGHGLTRAPERYTLSGQGLADFVDAFAARLSLPAFVVAGNSMGGGAAWQLAVRHPRRIAALILVDALGFANETPPGKTPLAFRILQYPIGRAILRNIDNRPLIAAILKHDVCDTALITPPLVARWADLQRAPGHRAVLLSFDPSDWGDASTAALNEIQVPTLIMHGESDVLIEPATARKFAAAIPGAKLVTYSQVGHLPQIEIPRRSAADVGEFLQATLEDRRCLPP